MSSWSNNPNIIKLHGTVTSRIGESTFLMEDRTKLNAMTKRHKNEREVLQ